MDAKSLLAAIFCSKEDEDDDADIVILPLSSQLNEEKLTRRSSNSEQAIETAYCDLADVCLSEKLEECLRQLHSQPCANASQLSLNFENFVNTIFAQISHHPSSTPQLGLDTMRNEIVTRIRSAGPPADEPLIYSLAEMLKKLTRAKERIGDVTSRLKRSLLIDPEFESPIIPSRDMYSEHDGFFTVLRQDSAQASLSTSANNMIEEGDLSTELVVAVNPDPDLAIAVDFDFLDCSEIESDTFFDIPEDGAVDFPERCRIAPAHSLDFFKCPTCGVSIEAAHLDSALFDAHVVACDGRELSCCFCFRIFTVYEQAAYVAHVHEHLL